MLLRNISSFSSIFDPWKCTIFLLLISLYPDYGQLGDVLKLHIPNSVEVMLVVIKLDTNVPVSREQTIQPAKDAILDKYAILDAFIRLRITFKLKKHLLELNAC